MPALDLACRRSSFARDCGLFACCTLLRSLLLPDVIARMGSGQLSEETLALVCGTLAVVSDALALVRDALALVRDALALGADQVALLDNLLALADQGGATLRAKPVGAGGGRQRAYVLDSRRLV